MIRFERQEDGGVLVYDRLTSTTPYRFSADEWAGIVGKVSSLGDEDGRSFLMAKAFHSAEDVVLPPAEKDRLLIIHGDVPHELLAELSKMAGCNVIQLFDGDKLENMDEQAMNFLGWFRFDLDAEDVL